MMAVFAGFIGEGGHIPGTSRPSHPRTGVAVATGCTVITGALGHLLS
ncbi:hypothetical protein ACFWWT_19210 [Streptomyces sp. NPDC058676]